MTEPTEVRAFVNGAAVAVARGATVIDAVRAHDATIAEALVAGTRAATDSRGLPVALTEPVSGGMVLRIVSARALGGNGDDE
ncbi:MAG: hypothetical protein WCL36_05305 [bacterium]|jgi:hypothetical protein